MTSLKLSAGSLFSVKGKTALVSGAMGHLGKVIVSVLRDNGARVIRLYNKSAPETPSRDDFKLDMYNSDGYPALKEFAAKVPVDILVNNAHEMSQETGFNVLDDPLANYDPMAAWKNYVGGYAFPAVLVSYFGTGMRDRRHGSIINICTMDAKVAPSPILYEGTRYSNPPHYGASKAALMQFTRYVASYWRQYGVRCNSISPGPFPKSTADTGFMQRLADRTSLARVGEARELAGALLYLASDASSYTTGTDIAVDGGWTSV